MSRIARLLLIGSLCSAGGWLTTMGGGSSLAAEPAASAKPTDKPDDALRYTEVRHLPRQVTLAHLSNGLTVIVQENHVAAVATVRCFVKNTGSAYEGKYLGAGLSHVLEHVVAGGSTKNAHIAGLNSRLQSARGSA